MEQEDVNQTNPDVDLTNLTFNELPKAMSWLISKTLEIERKLEEMPMQIAAPGGARQGVSQDVTMWFTVKELSDYLPFHPAQQTIYGWTSSYAIPFHKKGKRTFFRKDEVDEWMSGEKFDTAEDMEDMAQAFILQKKKEAYVR